MVEQRNANEVLTACTRIQAIPNLSGGQFSEASRSSRSPPGCAVSAPGSTSAGAPAAPRHHETLRPCLGSPARRERTATQGTQPKPAKEICRNPSALELQIATVGKKSEFLFCYP